MFFLFADFRLFTQVIHLPKLIYTTSYVILTFLVYHASISHCNNFLSEKMPLGGMPRNLSSTKVAKAIAGEEFEDAEVSKI